MQENPPSAQERCSYRASGLIRRKPLQRIQSDRTPRPARYCRGSGVLLPGSACFGALQRPGIRRLRVPLPAPTRRARRGFRAGPAGRGREVGRDRIIHRRQPAKRPRFVLPRRGPAPSGPGRRTTWPRHMPGSADTTRQAIASRPTSGDSVVSSRPDRDRPAARALRSGGRRRRRQIGLTMPIEKRCRCFGPSQSWPLLDHSYSTKAHAGPATNGIPRPSKALPDRAGPAGRRPDAWKTGNRAAPSSSRGPGFGHSERNST